MTQTWITKSFAMLVALSLIGSISCSPRKDEDRIREMMKEAGRLIEKKDIPSLMSLLSDDYTDDKGRDKIQTGSMVQTYFQEFRGIVIHSLGTRIDELEEGAARIRTDAAISSGAAKALRKLVPVSTDNYRFRIELIKEQDRWLIRYAEWKHIGAQELFPESLSILKKLFSDK